MLKRNIKVIAHEVGKEVKLFFKNSGLITSKLLDWIPREWWNSDARINSQQHIVKGSNANF